ncbi:MAG: DNA polymerase III subunit delta [Tenericutes bacterium]|nr:MAG: DNA polymerase III subunit delta [Mycoplasmatota bacterium]
MFYNVKDMKYFYGQETYLINREIKRISKSGEYEVVIYDETSKLDDIIMEITTYSLFNDDKLIILKNISAFSNKDEAMEIINTISKSLEGVTIIFVTYDDKIPKGKLGDYLKKNSETREFKSLSKNDVPSTIIEIVESKGGSITNGAAISLANKIPHDLRIIISEIEKLLHESNEITQEMIDHSISDYSIIDAFAFSNAVASLDTAEIMSTYQIQIQSGKEPMTLIAQMATVFTLAETVDSYKEVGMNLNQIATETGIHKFRIKKANELLNRLTRISIHELITKLTELESNIKSGLIDPKIGLTNFLLHLIK